MSKTAIANIGENDFDDWRQMFVYFAILHDVSPTPEGVARTWGWLCDPTNPETGLIVRVRDAGGTMLILLDPRRGEERGRIRLNELD